MTLLTYCLRTLVLDRPTSYSAHGIPLTTYSLGGVAMSDRKGGAGPHAKVKEAGHRPQSCVRLLSWTRDVIRASHVQGPSNTSLQPMSHTNRLGAIQISWCRSVFTFLAFAFALPTRTSGNMLAFFGTGPPYGMRRPSRLLCSTLPHEASAGGRGKGPGSVTERCSICMTP